jgi:hypothetical protein
MGGRHTWLREGVTGNLPGPRMKREKNEGSGGKDGFGCVLETVKLTAIWGGGERD